MYYYLSLGLSLGIMHFECDKPELRLSYLYKTLWKVLFTAIWEQCNTTVHGPNNLSDKYEWDKLHEELIEWKKSLKCQVRIPTTVFDKLFN